MNAKMISKAGELLDSLKPTNKKRAFLDAVRPKIEAAIERGNSVRSIHAALREAGFDGSPALVGRVAAAWKKQGKDAADADMTHASDKNADKQPPKKTAMEPKKRGPKAKPAPADMNLAAGATRVATA